MLLVRGLSSDVTSDQLKALFAPYGEVNWTRLVNDTDGQTVTFGYVEMASTEDADRAILALDGTTVMDKRIKVEFTNDVLVKRGT